ncbi:shikimate kinase [Oceanicoccus sagamiensis]|uniref:Shikimate kinase n=1 Tax=Oceanicoccus sagamiensis TaxID=716816 RepID=A0A1X9N3X1_9GAMM|nr:shikimate kinase [Oceanicoccus sagamiensis]ARN72878.1 shikimate kinase [Oceanicoccus sagamiensis]
MSKIVIFGNSGSGKSTLARQLSHSQGLVHLDLDTLAWKPTSPPERVPIEQSSKEIGRFVSAHKAWVIEGCYSDLLALIVSTATEIIFTNLPVELCIENAKNRPWEPHKYPSKAAQDDNLAMLTEWIARYPERDDTFSFAAHKALYDAYSGKKTLYSNNDWS